jgi:hypothetical protein
MRILCRRERPSSGAQLCALEEADGWRYQLLATNTPGRQLDFLQARHRAHARVEDRVRTGKDTGLDHLPSTSMAINAAWCMTAMLATDLLCWFRLLCLHRDLARAEPKTLRYRLLHTAAHRRPDRPWPTPTKDQNPQSVAVGRRTRRRLPRRPRPTHRPHCTDLTAPHGPTVPDPSNPTAPWNRRHRRDRRPPTTTTPQPEDQERRRRSPTTLVEADLHTK